MKCGRELLCFIFFLFVVRCSVLRFEPSNTLDFGQNYLREIESQHHLPLDGGCYYVDTSLLACVAAVVQTCDNIWDFSLVKPFPNSRGAYVIVQNIQTEDDFTQCFDIDENCSFCSLFENTNFNQTVLTLSININETCDGESVGNAEGDFYALGVNCGTTGYFYYSCQYALQEPFSVAPSKVDEFVDIIQDYKEIGIVHNSDWIYENECVKLKNPNGGDPTTVFCPSVTLDTCSHLAFLQTRGGVSLKLRLSTNSTNSVCLNVEEKMSICARVYSIFITTKSVSLRISISLLDNDFLLGTFSTAQLNYTFPACGLSMSDGCWLNYNYSFTYHGEMSYESWTYNSEPGTWSITPEASDVILPNTGSSRSYWWYVLMAVAIVGVVSVFSCIMFVLVLVKQKQQYGPTYSVLQDELELEETGQD